ncbi:MAG: putative metal-binding motif-containing protein [Campylobacterota bacterium]|nr:putative metal-binding motif-containing protein [Campylobacterota bacterium]
MKKFMISFVIFNILFFQVSVVADMLFYYSSSILPSTIAAKESVVHYPTSHDKYEGSAGDNNPSNANVVRVGEALQVRSIYPYGDVDWVKVELQADKTYEFFATNLNGMGDTFIYLYSENDLSMGAELTYNDNSEIFNDSLILYDIKETGTYYLKIRAYEAIRLTNYKLGVREYIDSDGDGFSITYDCNDSNENIYVGAEEIAGDGIDQDCSGVDALDGKDKYDDDDINKAKAIPETDASYGEIQYRSDIFSQMRTLDTTDDKDFYSIDIPAYSAAYILENSSGVSSGLNDYNWTLYGSSSLDDVIESNSSVFVRKMINTTDTNKVFYLEISSNGLTGWYLPTIIHIGEDNDNDGFYTKDMHGDCNDNNESINYNAVDTEDDGIDQNCDGVDGNNEDYTT